eukprot:gene32900-43435_t
MRDSRIGGACSPFAKGPPSPLPSTPIGWTPLDVTDDVRDARRGTAAARGHDGTFSTTRPQ